MRVNVVMPDVNQILFSQYPIVFSCDEQWQTAPFFLNCASLSLTSPQASPRACHQIWPRTGGPKFPKNHLFRLKKRSEIVFRGPRGQIDIKKHPFIFDHFLKKSGHFFQNFRKPRTPPPHPPWSWPLFTKVQKRSKNVENQIYFTWKWAKNSFSILLPTSTADESNPFEGGARGGISINWHLCS